MLRGTSCTETPTFASPSLGGRDRSSRRRRHGSNHNRHRTRHAARPTRGRGGTPPQAEDAAAGAHPMAEEEEEEEEDEKDEEGAKGVRCLGAGAPTTPSTSTSTHTPSRGRGRGACSPARSTLHATGDQDDDGVTGRRRRSVHESTTWSHLRALALRDRSRAIWETLSFGHGSKVCGCVCRRFTHIVCFVQETRHKYVPFVCVCVCVCLCVVSTTLYCVFFLFVVVSPPAVFFLRCVCVGAHVPRLRRPPCARCRS